MTHCNAGGLKAGPSMRTTAATAAGTLSCKAQHACLPEDQPLQADTSLMSSQEGQGTNTVRSTGTSTDCALNDAGMDGIPSISGAQQRQTTRMIGYCKEWPSCLRSRPANGAPGWAAAGHTFRKTMWHGRSAPIQLPFPSHGCPATVGMAHLAPC